MDLYGNDLKLPLVTSSSAVATISTHIPNVPDGPSEIENEIEFVEAPFLIFRLGASLFGVPSLAVREILAFPALSPFQETAPFIVGVLNLRGAIVPVMDLSARFGHQAAPYRLQDNLIVLSWGGANLALVVHEVCAVRHIVAAQIEEAPLHGRQRDLATPFIAGVAQIMGEIVMLLHLPHLLNWPTREEVALSQTETSESSNATQTLAPPCDLFDFQTWTPSERAILEERAARLLPLTEAAADSAGERAPVAVVAIGGEVFGVELSVVREFVSVSAVATVPCCPPHILGQINLRGDIVTLVDVRPTLRTARTEPHYFDNASRQRGDVAVVVVQHEDGPVGVVIDHVSDVLYLRDNERLPVAVHARGRGYSGQYFTGGALHEGRLLPLLDMTKLFIEGELAVNEDA